MKVGTVTQFKDYDKFVLEDVNIIDLVLKAATAAFTLLKSNDDFKIVCGNGNNGADGLALATLLIQRRKKVTCYILDSEERSEANSYYLSKVKEAGIEVKTIDENFKYEIKDGIIVDCLFGTGLNKEVKDPYYTIIEQINFSDAKVVSIDIPSGLDGDNGEPQGIAVRANATVTFVALKLGFLNADSKQYTGRVEVVDLGVSKEYEDKVALPDMLYQGSFKVKPRYFAGYKNKYGEALLCVGSHQYKGAAIIASSAALKTGCGIVRIESDPEVSKMAVMTNPEIVMNNEMSHIPDGILFGCGKGINEQTEKELLDILQTQMCPLVLDADGITMVSDHLEELKNYPGRIILTPHNGEMKRLLKHKEFTRNLSLEAKLFAKEHNCIVVLKGPYTLVTDGNESYRIFTGDRAMATAGMGDSLAGIITSLLVMGYEVFEAAKLGVYIHGEAGKKVAKNKYTVLASDLIEQIPEVMYELSIKG